MTHESDPHDFLDSLAAGDVDDAEDFSEEDFDDEGSSGSEAPSGAGKSNGSTAAAPAGANGAAPRASPGGPSSDRDHVSNLNAALREERSARKQLEQRLIELEAKLPKQAPPEPEKEPDFLEDPKAVVDKLTKRLDETEKQRKEREEAEVKQREHQAKAQENWGKVLGAEAEFLKTTPDYHQALQHVRGILTQQVKLANPEATDEQVAQHIAIQEAQGAMHILSQGRNPSEVYYEYAKALGYKQASVSGGAQQPGAVGKTKPDKDSVRSMGSGGGDGVTREEPGRRKWGLPELAAAHDELKAERKKSARNR